MIRFDPIRGLAVGFVMAYGLMTRLSRGVPMIWADVIDDNRLVCSGTAIMSSSSKKTGNLMLGVFFIIIAIGLGSLTSSLQSDYEEYCTGIVGFFVELGSEGECTNLENTISMTSMGTAICGLIGFALLILGLSATEQNQTHVMLVPVQNQQFIAGQSPQQQMYVQPVNQPMMYQTVPNYKNCQICGASNHLDRKNCGSCKNRLS